MLNRFNRATPGQSLTDQPGNAPWEHPPQFNDVPSALEFIYQQCMGNSNLTQILAMLRSDVPVEAIVRTILYTGFTQGKWTPDLIITLNKPVTQFILAIGLRAGMRPTVGLPHRYKNKSAEMVQKLAEIKAQADFNKGDIHPDVHGAVPEGIPLMGVLKRKLG